MRDPFARLPTRVRLWSAALLCLAPMGLVWDVGAGFLSPGITMYGDCGYTEYTYCTPDTYLPGYYVPGQVTDVSQSPIRAFVVFAAAAFVIAAVRRRTAATRRVARLGTLALGFAVFLAMANGSPRIALIVALAVILVAPLVWPLPRAGRGVLASGHAAG